MLSPDIGVSEMLVVAIVALIVVGPKDLPLLLRRLGQFIAKLRGMAAEFRASFEDMARQSELEELRKEVEAMRSGQFTAPLHEAADAARDPHVDQVFAEIDAGLRTGQTSFSPAMVSMPVAEESVAETIAAPAKAPRKPRAKAAPVEAPLAKVAEAPVKAAAPKRAAPKAAAAKVAAKAAPKSKPIVAGGKPASSDIVEAAPRRRRKSEAGS
jgi:sec-independent protein translocase protein TatB